MCRAFRGQKVVPALYMYLISRSNKIRLEIMGGIDVYASTFVDFAFEEELAVPLQYLSLFITP